MGRQTPGLRARIVETLLQRDTQLLGERGDLRTLHGAHRGGRPNGLADHDPHAVQPRDELLGREDLFAAADTDRDDRDPQLQRDVRRAVVQLTELRALAPGALGEDREGLTLFERGLRRAERAAVRRPPLDADRAECGEHGCPELRLEQRLLGHEADPAGRDRRRDRDVEE